MIPEMFSNMNITLVIKYNNLHTNTINLPRHCKIFHIKLNYFSGSFQICKEAMHIGSLRVNGMSVKMFISVKSYFHHRVIYRPHITIPILYSFDMKVFSDSLNVYMFFHVLVDNPDSPTNAVLS